MRTLYVLRHAKSSWSNAKIADHERPLNDRGRHAVKALAEHIKASRISPALVLCSTARRAQDTLEGVRAGFSDEVDVWLEDELYGAGARDLLRRLQRLPPTVPSAMLVGHNPAVHELVLALVAGGDHRSLARLQGKFPTGALATLSFDADWASLDRATATLDALVVPRELDDPG